MADDIPDTGAVFTFGKSHFADNEPSHFFIKNDPVVALSCGDEHSAVICQNGRVFVFGGNSWGQLGLGHKDVVSRPSCVKWLKPHRALFVACGRAHTVFVTDTQAIYTVGCNDEGQLGTGDTEHHAVPQYVEVECEDLQIKQVSAGSNHTAILTESGKVFVCGSNSEGQLGLGDDIKSCLKFTELKFMEKIGFIECGYYHTVFITSKGAVFVTGDNEGQKLGIPDGESSIFIPVVLPIDTEIKSACCGANHTFLLSMDESKVFALGSNEKGQIGFTKDVERITEPKEIDMNSMFGGFQLKLVACGAMHTAFVTENGLLYTCGEWRHNKLCLEEIEEPSNNDDGVPNQYLPKRVNAMNGFIVDNVACGGCHTLLTATKGSNSDFTNNDFSAIQDQTRMVTLTELPPLQKVLPFVAMKKDASIENNSENQEINTLAKDEKEEQGENQNEASAGEDNSINSLEANVSGSHSVNIDDLDNDNNSAHGVMELVKDENAPSAPPPDKSMSSIIDKMGSNMTGKLQNITESLEQKVDETVNKVTKEVKGKVEAVEDFIEKTKLNLDPCKICDERKVLDIPDKIDEVSHSPPPKTPILQELLEVPDLTQISPNVSKTSDMGDDQKSECGSKSENETIPCASDKSSPQSKVAKTQAVMPIVRSDDTIDAEHMNDEGVVVNKLEEKGRFSRMFQSIRDKENSCMGKGKVIEEKVEETVHKGISNAEETLHKIEETVETEIRNQTNSRTCTIL